MKKIVILGCENSHANMFLDFMKANDKYSDVEVIGVFSEDSEVAKKFADHYGVPNMNSYDEAVGKVDGIIVTARHGANHYKYAKPYIESGVPMFIDKPVTVNGDEAVEFMRECKKAGVRLTGGSCAVYADIVKQLKSEHENAVDGKTIGGFVRAPLNMHNPWGGFYFYTDHLISIMGAIFGKYPKSVKAFVNDNKTNVIVRYNDFDINTLFFEGNAWTYYAMRVAEQGVKLHEVPVVSDDLYCFKTEFDEFYRILSGGEQAVSYKDFIATVFILDAINESIETGKEVAVKEFEV
ncbi:MAG: Gfo/Idh/MocA family oxidoreductase [Clostridia bacterium]|nr:Gfo/Idh/MocA family oxidoreductase [Clostridia bacterium]